MKKMKYLIIIIAFSFTFSCKSQVVSLETMAQCMQDNPPFPCPNMFTYVKDVNNTLNKYVGTWKGIYDGKIYEMNLLKKENVDVDGIVKEDRLIGRLRITTTGNLPLIIFDNFNEPDDTKTNFEGLGLTSNLQSYSMFFSGPVTSGCINYGKVFLMIKPANPNTLNIFFDGNYDTVMGECPNTFKTTIPEKQNIYLTKQ